MRKKKVVSFYLDEDLLEALERIAKVYGNRSKALEKAVKKFLDEVSML